MSLSQKSDVKNHLSRRNHRGIHLYPSLNQSSGRSRLAVESGLVESPTGHVAQASTERPTSSGLSTLSAAIEPGLGTVPMLAVSKSAQA